MRIYKLNKGGKSEATIEIKTEVDEDTLLNFLAHDVSIIESKEV